jgi:phytoene synthase
MTSDPISELPQADKDRYISLLFAPSASRPKLAALYLFNAELERIPKLVSEPQLGAIRLQWWREAVDAIYNGDAPEHPLVQSLAPVIRESGIPVEGLLALVDAHEAALYREVPETLEDLERHLGQSSSMLMQLAVMVLGGSAPETAGLAGVAYGLARLLHQSPRWFVPADMLGDLGKEVALNTLARHAHRRLLEARKTAFATDLLPAFLVAATVPAYLSAVGKNPDGPGTVSPLRRQLAIWWAARRNRF